MLSHEFWNCLWYSFEAFLGLAFFPPQRGKRLLYETEHLLPYSDIDQIISLTQKSARGFAKSMGRRLEKYYLFCNSDFLSLFTMKFVRYIYMLQNTL